MAVSQIRRGCTRAYQLCEDERRGEKGVRKARRVGDINGRIHISVYGRELVWRIDNGVVYWWEGR